MDPLRISAVSYLNTFPFVHGILNSGRMADFRLDLDVPSACAEKLRRGKADVALVPVGALPSLPGARIVTDYCIGAVNEVKTVLLLSRVPADQIRSIHLDADSRTSVALIRVLSREYWKINPEWIALPPGGLSAGDLPESVVAIGDKTFELRHHYPFVFDLASAWIDLTSLPFVFAVWVTNRELPAETLQSLNNALAYGVGHPEASLTLRSAHHPPAALCLSYLQHNISYELDGAKRTGMEKFLGYLR